MANLLKDSVIQVKMLEILGFTPTTLWTDIAWERLCELVGYDLSESEVKEVFQGGKVKNPKAIALLKVKA